MKLLTIASQFVAYRKCLGEKFLSNETILKAFVKFIGQDKDIIDVQGQEVDAFLKGKGPITNNWHCKHKVLRGFYRYAVGRGYVQTSPLPTVIPRRLPYLLPYIYKVKELRALLDATLSYQKLPKQQLQPYMIRTVLLLLYGAGLRISEAINLRSADINLPQALVTIRETKFQKTRLVPLGTPLTQCLWQYTLQRQREDYSQDAESFFFTGRNGKIINMRTFEEAFEQIRKKAGVRRADSHRYQPRLHDLRHTFAVHRLTAWYKQGADVQKWLPVLSVYLGHAKLAATSVYLTMTPALLQEAGRRFEHYAFQGGRK